MNVLILHGILGKAGENWEQWLHDELISKSYTVTMPNLPDPDHPSRQKWLAQVTENIKNPEETIIVAHSSGVTSGLDYLEKASRPIKGFVSVSGFAGDIGLELNSYFLNEKAIDFELVNKNIGEAFVFFGDNDPYVPQVSLHMLANDLKVNPVIIPEGGHLNTAAGFTQFPQILDAVLSV